MITNSVMNNDLVTVDFFHLSNVLIKLVRTGKLTQSEREDLLHKAGLLKLENNEWKQPNGSILTLHNE